jgi:hypothetical protein
MSSLVSFQPGAPAGLRPSERDLTEIALSSRTPHPLLRLAIRPLQQTLGLLSFGTSEIGRHEDVLIEQPIQGLSLSEQWRLGALSAHRHCCQSGLASGVSSLCRLGFTAAGFLHVQQPGSLGPSSSLGHSPSEPWPHGRRRALHAPGAPRSSNPRPLPRAYRLNMRSASSRHYGKHPCWVLLPVLQSVKELGSWLTSSEAAGP